MKFSYMKCYPNGLKIATEPKFSIMDRTSRDEYFQHLRDVYGVMTEEKGGLWRTVRRIKMMIRDYALSNDLPWFCTLTLREQVYERDEFKRIVSQWCENVRKRHMPDFKYIILYERHEKGGWHAHCLFSEDVSKYMVYAQMRRSKRLTSLVKSYNFSLWKKGFSTCERVEDPERVSTYILKYITKDLEIEKGKRNYLCSKNLDVPIVLRDVEITDVDKTKIEEYQYFLVYKMADTAIVDYI